MAGIFFPVTKSVSAPLLRFCHYLNHVHQLTLLAGRQLFTGMAQGGDNFRLLWLWPGFLDGQYQTARHHPHSPRPADGSPAHRQAVTRLPPRRKALMTGAGALVSMGSGQLFNR